MSMLGLQNFLNLSCMCLKMRGLREYSLGSNDQREMGSANIWRDGTSRTRNSMRCIGNQMRNGLRRLFNRGTLPP